MSDGAEWTMPVPRSHPLRSPDEYLRMRDEAPVCPVRLPDGTAGWAVTGYAEAEQVLGDKRFIKEAGAAVDPAPDELPDDFLTGMARGLSAADPVESRLMGAAAGQLLTESRIARFEALTRGVIDECLDLIEPLAPGPADLIESFVAPVSLFQAYDLMGVPYGEFATLRRHSEALVDHTRTSDDRRKALAWVLDLLRQVVAAKLAEPDGDDLLGAYIHQHRDRHGRVDEAKIAWNSVVMLTVAYINTASAMSLGALALLTDPELADFRAAPRRDIALAEELVRFGGVNDEMLRRTAAESATVGGVRVQPGDVMFVVEGVVNRDASVFDEPDRIEAARFAGTGQRDHISFGRGEYLCTARALVTGVLADCYESLFRRLPGLRLDGEIDQLLPSGQPTYGLRELPVRWNPPPGV